MVVQFGKNHGKKPWEKPMNGQNDDDLFGTPSSYQPLLPQCSRLQMQEGQVQDLFLAESEGWVAPDSFPGWPEWPGRSWEVLGARGQGDQGDHTTNMRQNLDTDGYMSCFNMVCHGLPLICVNLVCFLG